MRFATGTEAAEKQDVNGLVEDEYRKRGIQKEYGRAENSNGGVEKSNEGEH